MDEVEELTEVEERAEEPVEPAEELTESIDVEEVVWTPRYDEEPPPHSYIISMAAWLIKLEELRKILKEELDGADSLNKKALIHEISEVEKEIRYVRWRLYEAVKSYSGSCDKNCSECPIRDICESLPKRVPPSKGSKEPWLIASLMHKYRLL